MLKQEHDAVCEVLRKSLEGNLNSKLTHELAVGMYQVFVSATQELIKDGVDNRDSERAEPENRGDTV